MTDKDLGVSPAGSGHSAEPEPISVVSAETASVPNAAEDRILRAIERALEPLNNANLGWQEYYRHVRAAPQAALAAIREANVLFRLPEQADWPLLIEAFSTRPCTLTIRTQMTIGGQTFGLDQQQDDRMLYIAPDRELAAHMGRHAIMATLEAVAKPYFEVASVQMFKALIERKEAAHG